MCVPVSLTVSLRCRLNISVWGPLHYRTECFFYCVPLDTGYLFFHTSSVPGGSGVGSLHWGLLPEEHGAPNRAGELQAATVWGSCREPRSRPVLRRPPRPRENPGPADPLHPSLHFQGLHRLTLSPNSHQPLHAGFHRELHYCVPTGWRHFKHHRRHDQHLPDGTYCREDWEIAFHFTG